MFTVEEQTIINLYRQASSSMTRSELLAELTGALSVIDDLQLRATVHHIITKLQAMDDQSFFSQRLEDALAPGLEA